MSQVSAALSLPLGDKVRVCLSAAVLLLAWGGVVVVSFDRFRSILLQIGTASERFVPGTPDPKRIAWAVDVADRHLPRSRKCLVRSLTTETLLTMYGYAPEHRIGVNRTDDGAVEAHSWIEHDGEILIGNVKNLSRYEPLPSLGSVDNL